MFSRRAIALAFIPALATMLIVGLVFGVLIWQGTLGLNGYATLVGSLKWSVPVAVLTGTVSYLSNGRLAALAASGWLASGAGDDYSSARHDEGYNSMTGLRMSGGVDAMGNAQGMDNSSASHEPPAPVFTPNSHDGGSWS